MFYRIFGTNLNLLPFVAVCDETGLIFVLHKLSIEGFEDSNRGFEDSNRGQWNCLAMKG